MIAKLIKSFLVLSVVVGVVAGAAHAYFTSSVTAEDNEIEAGSLLVAVDSAQNDSYDGTWGYSNAWNVVKEELNGTVVLGNPFLTWTGAAPGDLQHYYVGVRNRGDIPMQVRAKAVGQWVSGPRFGTTGCPANAASANAGLVTVDNVHLFAMTMTPTGGCDSEFGCRNLRDALGALGWSPVSGLTAGDSGTGSGNWFYSTVAGASSGDDSATRYTLGEREFSIYRVDLELNSATNSCYQGATYQFDLTVKGKQVTDPAW
jgi:predicted ribosomally synthesized peptide with SipW-like signal peptide